MMPAASRRLAYLVAAVFLLPGIGLYLFPDWSSDNFSWPLTPFVSMTMGSWFLGGAYLAWRGARLREWSLSYPGLVFLGVFGLLEMGVLLLHRDEVRFAGLLPTLHFLAILAALLAAGAWVAAWWDNRPADSAPGHPPPAYLRVLSGAFVLFAGYLGLRLLLGTSRVGSIWPGELSLVTARAFGAFYTALAIAVVPLVWSRSVASVLALLPPAAVGSVLITLPALVHLEQFDFDRQPGGLVYIGTYLFVLVAASVIVLRHRLSRTTG